jgi:phosphate transport system substrate-binding protein
MRFSFVLTLLLTGAPAIPAAADTLRVTGSTTVNPFVAEAAEILREESGLKIRVDTTGGSSGGIHALGRGRAEVAMSSRALNHSDRERHPGVRFTPHRVGEDAVALVVSRDVWDGGVKALDRERMRAIYQRKITRWKTLGGPDRRIAFFNKEPGRGTWEVFADWLYGEAADAPPVAHPEVGGNEETRTKVASTRGALSQLSASWVDGAAVRALGIENADGEPVFPTAASIADGTYPLNRTLWLITDGPPRGAAKRLIDFVRSERGRELVRRHGYLAPADLSASDHP